MEADGVLEEHVNTNSRLIKAQKGWEVVGVIILHHKPDPEA